MGNSNGKITAPVSLHADVFSVLGLARDEAGMCELTYACMNGHGKINKWSWVKPVRVITPAELSHEDFADADFGLAVGTGYADGNDALDAADTVDWAYNAPGVGDWCRLTDFDGYNHKAEVPFGFSIEAVKGLTGQYNPKIHAVGGKRNGSNVEMELEDFRTFKNVGTIGWAVIYRRQGSSQAEVYGVDESKGTVDYPLGGNANVEMNVSVSTGTYEACLCLWLPNRGYIPLPGAYGRVTAENQTVEEYLGVTVTVHTYGVAGNKNRIYSYVTFGNVGTGSKTFEYEYYIVVNSSKGSDNYEVKGGSLTVGAGDSVDVRMGSGNNNGYGLWTDETGEKNVTYSYLLVCRVDSVGYDIRKTGSVPMQ